MGIKGGGGQRIMCLVSYSYFEVEGGGGGEAEQGDRLET